MVLNKNRAKTDVYSEPMPNRGISQYNNSFIQDPYTQDDIEHINPANGVTSLSFSGTKPVNTFTFAQPCITTNSTNRISFF